MRIIVTGSLAWDYIMNFPGKFSDHILPEKVHMLTVSFLVDSMKRMRGGTAGNIAYTLALLGAKPLVVSAAGGDFADYRAWMGDQGIDHANIREVAGEFTASCFINTDTSNNQLVAFYPGAVKHAREVTLEGLGLTKDDWVIISPTDPDSMMLHTAECKKVGAKYVFDPGKQTPRLNKEQILGGVDGCAAFIGNDYEFGLMSKTTGQSEQALIDMSPVTFVTLGEQGSRIHVRGQGAIEVPVAPVSAVVDPTGAGDAYLGGIVYGLARGLPMDVVGRLGALVAAWAVEHKGCQEHTYTRDEVKARYQKAFGSALPAGAVA